MWKLNLLGMLEQVTTKLTSSPPVTGSFEYLKSSSANLKISNIQIFCSSKGTSGIKSLQTVYLQSISKHDTLEKSSFKTSYKLSLFFVKLINSVIELTHPNSLAPFVPISLAI